MTFAIAYGAQASDVVHQVTVKEWEISCSEVDINDSMLRRKNHRLVEWKSPLVILLRLSLQNACVQALKVLPA